MNSVLPEHPQPASRKQLMIRICVSVLIGLCGGYVCAINNPDPNPFHDLGWSFGAVESLLSGQDPYRHQPDPDFIPYPLTTAFVVGVFGMLPRAIGIPLFFGCGSAILAYGILRNDKPWRLLVFLSPSYIMAAKSMQWSPLFMSVLYIPALAWVLIAKPTLGVPVIMSIRWRPLPFIIGAILAGASLVVMPAWPLVWLGQTSSYSGFIPVFTGLGALLLLAAFAWTKLEARFLLWMSVIPQHVYWYDQLLLWAIPKTKRQMYLFTLLSWVAFFNVWFTYRTLRVSAPYIIVGLYLPALGLVLWPAVYRLARRYVLRERTAA